MFSSRSCILVTLISICNAASTSNNVKKFEDVSLPDNAVHIKEANSQTECILRCRRHKTNKNGFYTSNSECHCVSDAKNMTSGEISGNTISEVSGIN